MSSSFNTRDDFLEHVLWRLGKSSAPSFISPHVTSPHHTITGAVYLFIHISTGISRNDGVDDGRKSTTPCCDYNNWWMAYFWTCWSINLRNIRTGISCPGKRLLISPPQRDQVHCMPGKLISDKNRLAINYLSHLSGNSNRTREET